MVYCCKFSNCHLMVMQLYSFSFTSKLSYMLIICDYCMSHFLLASQIQTLSASLLIQKITFLFLTITLSDKYFIMHYYFWSIITLLMINFICRSYFKRSVSYNIWKMVSAWDNGEWLTLLLPNHLYFLLTVIYYQPLWRKLFLIFSLFSSNNLIVKRLLEQQPSWCLL